MYLFNFTTDGTAALFDFVKLAKGRSNLVKTIEKRSAESEDCAHRLLRHSSPFALIRDRTTVTYNENTKASFTLRKN